MTNCNIIKYYILFFNFERIIYNFKLAHREVYAFQSPQPQKPLDLSTICSHYF